MSGAASKPTGAFVKALAGILRGQVGTHQLSHQAIADAVGISRPQVSKILNGDKPVDMELLDELCWALGLSFRQTVIDADEKSQNRHQPPDWGTPTLVRS